MERRHRLSMMALILLMVWGCGKSSSMQGQAVNGTGQPMAKKEIRFTKAKNGVITDSVTGLEWYVGSDQHNTWYDARAWTKTLTVAGGGWRMPSLSELKALYQKEAGTYKSEFPRAANILLEDKSDKQLKNGNYLYRLEAGNYTSNKQMKLEK